MVGTSPSPKPQRVILWIMSGILAWGVFHAVGAWRLNHDPRRTVVVLGCTAAFLGFWATLLAARARRIQGR